MASTPETVRFGLCWFKLRTTYWAPSDQTQTSGGGGFRIEAGMPKKKALVAPAVTGADYIPLRLAA